MRKYILILLLFVSSVCSAQWMSDIINYCPFIELSSYSYYWGGNLVETKTYRDRVQNDGGTIANLDSVNKRFKMLKPIGLTNVYLDISPVFGIKKTGSNVTKMYNLVGSYDAIQDNASLYPTFNSTDVNYNGNASITITGKTFKIESLPLQTYTNTFVVLNDSATTAITHSSCISSNPGKISVYNVYPGEGVYGIDRSSTSHLLTDSFGYASLAIGGTKIIEDEYNATSQKRYINSYAESLLNTGSVLSNSTVTDQLNIFSANQTFAFGRGTFSELIITKQLTRNQASTIYCALKNMYIPDTSELFFRHKMHNSIEYNLTTRNPFGSYKFTYSGLKLKIAANPTIYSVKPNEAIIDVYVSDTLYQKLTYTAAGYKYVTFPAGTKTIELIEGSTTISSSIPFIQLGTIITSVQGKYNQFTLIEDWSVAEEITFLGNSITVGSPLSNPANQAFGRKFKIDHNIEVSFLGGGYKKLKDFAHTPFLSEETALNVKKLLTNATTKKVVLAIGTNDYGVDATDTTTLKIWYALLLDSIHAKIPTAYIYCITPLYRNAETALLGHYRTAISNVVNSGRTSYSKTISGLDLLSVSDYPGLFEDAIHPNIAGQDSISDRLYRKIYP